MQVIRSSFYLRRVEYTFHYKNINKVAVQNKNVVFFLFLHEHDLYKKIYESDTYCFPFPFIRHHKPSRFLGIVNA